MFRATQIPQAKSIQEHKLFGEMPRLDDADKRNSIRLADQVEFLKEKGYQDGYELGMANGLKLGEAEGRNLGIARGRKIAEQEQDVETAKFHDDCAELISEFEKMMEEWFIAAEKEMASRAMEVVRQVTAAELMVNPDTALTIAQGVLKHVTHAKTARIHVNPTDFALFSSHTELLKGLSQNLRNIEVIDDPDVASGIVVETEAGLVDATIETRLTLIENDYIVSDSDLAA